MKKCNLAIIITASLITSTSAWAIPVHSHGEKPTTWEQDAEGTSNRHPNNPALGKEDPEAGDTRHQHYDSQPLVNAPSRADPFTISGVWNNRTNYNFWRDIPTRPVAPYPVVPHGFIDESDPNNVPRYRFLGANWGTDAQAKLAQPLIVDAFGQWSALQAGVSPVSGLNLITGLEFTMAASDALAEIDILWGGTVALGENKRTIGAGGITTDFDVLFSSTVDWFFGKAADTPADKFHFFSTALHETGHVVGLYEQNDLDDVMILARDKGPNGPAFDALDVDSKRGAYALYSVVPEPSTILLFPVGLIALAAVMALAAQTRTNRSRSFVP